MSRARDLANLADEATVLATDSEVSAAVAAIDLTNVQRIVPVDSNISVPGAPTSVSATGGDAQATVSFVAPTDNGGSTILSYTVISSPGSIKKSGTTSPITITGLTNNTAYTFTVKAHNIAGSSVASSASSSVTPNPAISVNYLVVAGGAGGGCDHGAGGGAGGFRSTVTATGGGGSLESALSITLSNNYTVTVGAGGSGGTTSNGKRGISGSDSIFSTITSTGGGGGGGNGSNSTGATGGSGGGGSQDNVGAGSVGGSGTTNQGYAGGNGQGSGLMGGGGGGAGGTGTNATSTTGGNAGNGVATSITGSSVTYGGGGGGGGWSRNPYTPGTGGTGGGGAGAPAGQVTTGVSGTANTGGGGGGGGDGTGLGGAGGSGIVILRYPSSNTITIGAGLTGSTATDGSFKVTSLTAGTGNVSFA